MAEEIRVVFLTTSEAADLMGVAEQTLRLRRTEKWRTQGKTPGPPWYRVFSGIRYKRHEVEAYMDAQQGALRLKRLRPLARAPA